VGISEQAGGWVPNWAHQSLDKAGLIPGLGNLADGVNLVLYVSEGDIKGAAISAKGMLPGLGQAAVLKRLGGQIAGRAGARAAAVGAELYL
jgi:hypothetical protein